VSDGPAGWGAPLYEAVLDAASAVPGTTLLDLGCGPGEFARAAADRGATVTGVDRDKAAVAEAARRVPEGTFTVGDVLDPPPGHFDAAVAVQVLGHVPNPLVLLRAAGARGDLVIVTAWGREEECDLRAFGEALAPWLPPRPAPQGPPPITDPDRMRQLVELAGLDVVAVDEVVCPFRYADEDELVGPVLISGMGRHAINRGGPGAVRAALLERLAGRREADGSYVLENLFRVVTARPRA
jgi:SAM-dependent methyltransferase